MIFILVFMEHDLQQDAIHDFSVWLRAGSNPVDINQFRSHTVTNVIFLFLRYGNKCPYLLKVLFPGTRLLLMQTISNQNHHL